MVLIINIKALLVTVTNWKQPEYPSMKDWFNKFW